jgi:magnesium-transporting ATPase (P-type)
VVPADGRLISARALTVSEAALTGESLPVTKSVEVLGTMCRSATASTWRIEELL